MRSEQIFIPATYKDIRIPAERLRALLFYEGQKEEVINGCELALQELLTNLVDHAYGGDAGGLITVSISCDPVRILIETSDTGSSVNVDLGKVEMPDPTDLVEGGYGLAIIRLLMDEVNYKIDNGMNTWQLIKYF